MFVGKARSIPSPERLNAYLQNFIKMFFFFTFLENYFSRNIPKKNYLKYFLTKLK